MRITNKREINRNKTFLFYQSIGLIPLGAKSSDWVLHHMDETLKDKDPKRYSEYRVYDVIPLPRALHQSLHHKGKSKPMTDEHRRKISESMKMVPGHPQSKETRERLSASQKGLHKGLHWSIDPSTGKRYWYE